MMQKSLKSEIPRVERGAEKAARHANEKLSDCKAASARRDIFDRLT
jgi:hypothetical protein